MIALLWSGGVWADPAQELVSLLNSEQQAEQLQAQMQAQMIPLIIRGAGEHAQELAQHRDVLEAWVNRYLSWPAMSAEVAAIYRKHFTEAELQGADRLLSEPGREKIPGYHAGHLSGELTGG
ncbi:hypothetical protein [Aeromonas dhakensis]|uniref:hypothetical protein n=1 Tax=Aeromonas dhakensis TaxID=196024 RepID=UPI0020C4C745|nr:hypothetical protein [Aeromonas dhakensis]